MNEERMANAWELAAKICGRFDCDELVPRRTAAELADLDAIIDEMIQQAGRLRAEGVIIEVAHGNLISPDTANPAKRIDTTVGLQAPNGGSHLAQALADGRYDDSPTRRAWRHGLREKRRPTDPLPKGAKFGGQYLMDEPSGKAGA